MPLTNWTCDTCGDDITDPVLSLLIWREEGGELLDFRIVHKSIAPRTCDPGSRQGFVYNSELSNYLGADGLTWLLAFLSNGPVKGEGKGVPVRSLDEFVGVIRRLQTPWYEEARGRFVDEDVRRELDDANEVLPYLPRVLERIAQGTLN